MVCNELFHNWSRDFLHQIDFYNVAFSRNFFQLLLTPPQKFLFQSTLPRHLKMVPSLMSGSPSCASVSHLPIPSGYQATSWSLWKITIKLEQPFLTSPAAASAAKAAATTNQIIMNLGQGTNSSEVRYHDVWRHENWALTNQHTIFENTDKCAHILAFITTPYSRVGGRQPPETGRKSSGPLRLLKILRLWSKKPFPENVLFIVGSRFWALGKCDFPDPRGIYDLEFKFWRCHNWHGAFFYVRIYIISKPF